ncbi:hypothetical protein H0E84_16115 [Luteimonas sp. SJ-92]|uniref:Flagellar protein FliT n=1 Tax=Luteimonas salinisoli TaxID=2752307 RepID=A0A853JGC7_9GAMM|nr:hypothetical protein [Luteimonas salinisoli]NZA27905.1 hypothetical protein [Luteimonas salinisoli]
MSEPTLGHLQAGLDALAEALDQDDFAPAGSLLAQYDRDLRAYVETVGGNAPLGALRAMLQMQNSLAARMQERQRGIAAELRDMRQAGHAARAYSELG